MGKHIKKKNFGNLKSHDYQKLIQQILPLALRGCLALSPTSNECEKNYFLQISTLLIHFKLRFSPIVNTTIDVN
jgi:hypothetical protein